jgi:ParB family chromosome partitioning protein
MMTLSIGEISPNPGQPRKDFDSEALVSLADSIRVHGLIQPIIVSPSASGYQIIAGERRWRAAKAAGLTKIPAIIRDSQMHDALSMALVENIQREALNPIEEAEAYRRLADEFDLSHDDISKRVGKSRSAVTNSIRILSLPDEVRASLSRGDVSIGQVRPLLGLSDDKISELFKRILSLSLSSRGVEELVSAIDGKKKRGSGREKTKTESKDGEISLDRKKVQERLMNRYGRAVHIKGGEEKGVIQIEYYGKSDLIDLCEALLGEGR